MKEGEPKIQSVVDKKLEKVFKNQEVLPFEREKTLEETRITEQVLEYMPKFLEKYGGNFNENLTLNNIHFIDVNKLPEKVKVTIKDWKRDIRAQCVFIKGNILIYSEGENSNLLETASGLAHELIHINSYHHAVTDSSGETLETRISGIQIIPKKGEAHFNKINEGVTEELQASFDREYLSKIPELEKDLKLRARIAEKENCPPEYFSIFLRQEKKNGEDGWRAVTKDFRIGYHGRVSKMVKEIYAKNKTDFGSEEEVFNVFAENMMQGKTIQFAKLIKETYGEGAFRKLGEETKKK